MNLFDLLDRLRKEPEERRKRTALTVAFSITGIIAAAWLMAVSASSLVSYDRNTANASSSPLAAVGEVIKSGGALIGEFSRSFQETKNLIYELASSTASSTKSVP